MAEQAEEVFPPFLSLPDEHQLADLYKVMQIPGGEYVWPGGTVGNCGVDHWAVELETVVTNPHIEGPLSVFIQLRARTETESPRDSGYIYDKQIKDWSWHTRDVREVTKADGTVLALQRTRGGEPIKDPNLKDVRKTEIIHEINKRIEEFNAWAKTVQLAQVFYMLDAERYYDETMRRRYQILQAVDLMDKQLAACKACWDAPEPGVVYAQQVKLITRNPVSVLGEV